MNDENYTIKPSAIEPIKEAFERTKALLFEPFDITVWLIIGFNAFLAGLGASGTGTNFNFNPRSNGNVRQSADHIREFFNENLIPALLIGSSVIIIVLILSVVFAWLRSRGKFMFYHSIATRRAEIAEPWKKYSGLADRLFVFIIVVTAVFGAVIITTIGIGAFVTMAIQNSGRHISNVTMIPLFIIAFAFLFTFGLAFGLVSKLTNDFIVPIMMKTEAGILQTWRELWGLIKRNLGVFAVYMLLQFVFSVAVGAVIMIGFCFCCCVFFLLAVPYIGTVILLPLLAFFRYYAVCFLRQFGPKYDILALYNAPD